MYEITQANKADIPAIAMLFTQSFRDSVMHHCGRLPKPQAMQDVFSLVYEAEPEATLVARTREGQIIGYCLAPTRLHRLWVHAVLGGHLLKWAWRWLTGQYGFGLYPVNIIVLNKLAFLRSAMTPSKTADARILSVAVATDWRGQGVGKSLMKAAMDYFKSHRACRVRLEVRPDNTPAIKIYQDIGFISAGITADSQGDWLIMLWEEKNDSVSKSTMS